MGSCNVPKCKQIGKHIPVIIVDIQAKHWIVTETNKETLNCYLGLNNHWPKKIDQTRFGYCYYHLFGKAKQFEVPYSSSYNYFFLPISNVRLHMNRMR